MFSIRLFSERPALYVEPVIAFVTVQAQLLSTGDPDPVGAGLLTAAFAVIAVEDPGGSGQGNPGFHHVEELLAAPVKIIALGFLRGHVQGLGLQHQPDGLAGCPVVEGEGLLAGHVKQQIALADAAPQHHLNGIHTAGIVFRNTHHLLVVREGDVQQLPRCFKWIYSRDAH